jgi:hypothetical protein
LCQLPRPLLPTPHKTQAQGQQSYEGGFHCRHYTATTDGGKRWGGRSRVGV